MEPRDPFLITNIDNNAAIFVTECAVFEHRNVFDRDIFAVRGELFEFRECQLIGPIAGREGARDPAPLLPSLITRIRCDSGPVGTGLQTRLGPDRQGSCVAGRHCNRGARLR